mmetsp:Transcript_12253/g.21695  ORF Transcript_12253/g.21695 Transcript_12253/m.21695 type:complete len:275 (-) Transcript_12253:294-1118(-)
MPAPSMATVRSWRTEGGTTTCMATLRHSARSEDTLCSALTAAGAALAATGALAAFLSAGAAAAPAAGAFEAPGVGALTGGAGAAAAGLEAAGLSTCFTSVANCCLISLFSGSSNACSKHPKGRVTDAGSLICSGSFPRSNARLFDLAPTTPFLYSSIPTTHLPDQVGTSILRPFVGLLSVSLSLPALATSASTSVQLTEPEAVVLKLSVLPTAALICARGSGSWQVANSTRMLRARTLTCESTSGASGVMTATTPSGISSSPVTWDTRSTVGCV